MKFHLSMNSTTITNLEYRLLDSGKETVGTPGPLRPAQRDNRVSSGLEDARTSLNTNQISTEPTTGGDVAALPHKETMNISQKDSRKKGGADNNLSEHEKHQEGDKDGNAENDKEEKEQSNELIKSLDELEKKLQEMKRKQKQMIGPARSTKLTIGTLNTRGKINKGCKRTSIEMAIEYMRLANIDILAIQETRRKTEEEDDINERTRNFTIKLSGLATNSAGVGIILRDAAFKKETIKTTNIIPGHALQIEVETTEKEKIQIISIYAPNGSPKIKRRFYQQLNQKTARTQDTEMIMIGDFNLCEHETDREPRSDTADPIEIQLEWANTKTRLGIEDEWKRQNEDTTEFTFKQTNRNGTVRSRIDRIYGSQNIRKRMTEWRNHGSLGSDHDLITTNIEKQEDVKIEPKRFRLSEVVMQEKPFIKKFERITRELAKEMKHYECAARKMNKDTTGKKLDKLRQKVNPQTLWEQWKLAIKKAAQITNKERSVNFEKERSGVLKEIIELKANITMSEIEKQEEMNTLEGKITKLNIKKLDAIKLTAQTNWAKLGEKCSAYYFRLNKQMSGIDPIKGLKDRDGEVKRNNEDMTRIATEHHKNLQQRPEMTEEREQAIKEILEQVEIKITKEHSKVLDNEVKEEHIRGAIKKCKKGKSPGADGITYELYKWGIRHLDQKRKNNEGEPNLAELMTKYLKDIEEFGPQGRNFAEGIMHPCYKKGDREQIENYRPITLLNTDYKIYTRTLAYKLAVVGSEIIHKDQAGFMPGRSIYDHTRLVTMLEEACETEEVNGYILALDQEKAYDRIDHEYLWQTMKRYGFSEKYIQRTKNIYGAATTRILVNGKEGEEFPVERGVRQGDPMSCLLYNIAIEPLANALRKAGLTGIRLIQGVERALAIIYADDTAIALGEMDDIEIVERVTELFCRASTAKFNTSKTEIMAVGTTQFVQDFNETKIMGNQKRLPDDIRIVTRDNPMKMLGAWHGDKTQAIRQWVTILAKQQEIMKEWAKTRPTLQGKVLLLKALIASRSLYLATVNGMPYEVERIMEKQMRAFLWNDTKGLVRWDVITQPKENGGLGVPSIAARNKAIEIMWLKRLCTEEQKAPLWAKIAQGLLVRHSIHKETPFRQRKSISNWPIQQALEQITKLPENLQRMVTITKQTNMGISPALPSNELRLNMPAFRRIGLAQGVNKSLRCLYGRHKATTIRDMVQIRNESDENWNIKALDRGCTTPEKCKRKAISILNHLNEKWEEGPFLNADELTHTPKRIKKYKDMKAEEEPIAFNPDVTSTDQPRNEIRIFRKGADQRLTHAKKKQDPKVKGAVTNPAPPDTPRKKSARRRRITGTNQIQTVYVGGTAKRSGAQNAVAGVAVWYGESDPRNKAYKLKTKVKTKQRAELTAILMTLRSNQQQAIEIKTRSKRITTGILERHKQWEDQDWVGVQDEDIWKAIIAELRERNRLTLIRQLKAEDDTKEQKATRQLAKKGYTATEKVTKKDLEHNKNMLEDGIRLSNITLRMAYNKVIDFQKSTTWDIGNRKTRLQNAAQRLATTTGYKPRIKDMITATWKLPVNNNVKDFIWKVQLKLPKCGEYFSNMGEKWREKGNCVCGERESIEHILFQCEQNENGRIWEQVKNWGDMEPEYEIGTEDIISLSQRRIAQEKGKHRKQFDHIKERKRTTLIAYGAWAIWKARSKRVMNETQQNDEEAIETLKKDLQRRVQAEWIDIITNKESTQEQIDEYQKLWEDQMELTKTPASVEWKQA